MARGVVAAALVAALAACVPEGDSSAEGTATASPSPTTRTTPAPTTSTPTDRTRTGSPRATDARDTPHHASAPGTALAALAALQVKGRAPMTGYDRDRFGSAWSDTDRNGCDQRNDVLRRDLVDTTIKAGTRGCLVLSGTLHDPYTGMKVAFHRSSASYSPVQIDHVVALGDAWAMGAWRWSDAKRKQLANDPLELLAVDAHYNMSKGDGDAATWLPPRKRERCPYVARQVAVKAKYHLAVTSAEKSAMARVLGKCSGERLPTSKVIPLGGDHTASSASPTRDGASTSSPARPHQRVSERSRSGSSPSASSRAGGPIVHPGAFCAPTGAIGWTSAGTMMKCSVGTGQDRARWRSAG